MPLIDNECFLLDWDEFISLHKFYGEKDAIINLGKLTEEPWQEIKLAINKLLASHIGIFGNTWSGKSNTLAKIYTEVFNECKNLTHFKEKSKFIIIDFNWEYVSDNMITDPNDKMIYKLSTLSDEWEDRYVLPTKCINKLEILSVLLEATEKTQVPFLSRAIANTYFNDNDSYLDRVRGNIGNICKQALGKKEKGWATTIIPDLLKDLIRIKSDDIDNPDTIINDLCREVEQKLEFHSHNNNEYYWRDGTTPVYNSVASPIYEKYIKAKVDNISFTTDPFTKLKLKIILNYYHDTIKWIANPEHIRPLVWRMFKKIHMLEKLIELRDDAWDEANQRPKNLTIVSLKDVNTEMKKIIPLIVCKQLYDDQKKHSDQNKSLHIIIDEAHNILSNMSQRESETWKDYRLETFEEIIKEGRKFGVFLTIASQRPYDISTTIISQLHNYFIHRLMNNNDIEAIAKAVAYLDKFSFESIAVLSIGSCFVAWLASDIPIKVDIDLLDKDKQPMSQTLDLENSWWYVPEV